MAYYVSFFNMSSVVSDADLESAVNDLQLQVSEDFAPAWGVDATIDIGGTGWPITIVDNPGPNDPQGALGYHSLDTNYNPYGVIFAQLSNDNNVPWTGVASHELLEMLGDPLTNSTCFIDNGDGTGYIIIQEVCDPTEQQLYYQKGGTPVSDFALRGWFIPGYTGQVDFMGAVPGPLQLQSGDYISVDQVTASTGWQEVTGDQITRMSKRIRQKIDAVQPPLRQMQHPVRIQALPNGTPKVRSGSQVGAGSSSQQTRH